MIRLINTCFIVFFLSSFSPFSHHEVYLIILYAPAAEDFLLYTICGCVLKSVILCLSNAVVYPILKIMRNINYFFLFRIFIIFRGFY